MKWHCDGKAASGERAVASASRRSSTTALARLEPQRTSAGLYPTRAAPTPRSKPVASRGASGSFAMRARKLLGK
jgi:hypothetical protein